MHFITPSKHDFDKIKEYVSLHDIGLLILDFNGVLDDYYAQKETFLRNVLGRENEHHLLELWLMIERAYIADRTTSINHSLTAYFETVGLPFTKTQSDMLAHSRVTSKLTNNAKVFLDSLDVPFVIYTSLSKEQATQSIGDNTYDLFTRDQYQEEKPSVANLVEIVKRYGVAPHQICIVGDGLTDDLMPAALMGMHTILLSPYADVLINPTKP